jgi:hypothetical protein
MSSVFRGSVFGQELNMQQGVAAVSKTYSHVEDLEVYERICELHVEECDLTRGWPQEERYELGS